MEDRPFRDSASRPDFGPSESLVEPPRKRAGGNKRKSPSSIFGVSSSSSFASAKRQAKERNNVHALLPPIHNGPVTRARQSPNKLAAAAAAAAAAGGTDQVGKVEREEQVPSKEDEETVEEQEPLVDVEFDAVRSRGSDVHVVPTHAGWFSWKKVHQLEEQMMPSFFSGKSEKRNCDIYVKIRNSMMKKFRGDPHIVMEMKDLGDIAVEDTDAWQEVMEFLDCWGLINFHPFPPPGSDASAPENDEAAKSASMLEKLYQFKAARAPSSSEPKRIGATSPVVQLPGFLPEAALAEELVRPEEPSVEYHCNSCSGDCSRKRYHCQRQADFDLCSECYNANKFGPGMVSTDFILMESAEARGVSGGSWTDQETLLLLEALELFGENWNEIAEHVATKTKAQCILHFLQMPIDDPFLEGSDSLEDALPGNTEPSSTNKESSALDAREMVDARNPESSDQLATSQSDLLEKNVSSKTEVSQDSNSNVAMDALKNAFLTVGSISEPGENLSFAEAGNPVMALAAFLAGVIEPNVAILSTRSSLKSMSEESPGIQLATRHCFPLEEPPNDGKCNPSVSKHDGKCNPSDVEDDSRSNPTDAKDDSKGNPSDAKDGNEDKSKDAKGGSNSNPSETKDTAVPESEDILKEENQTSNMSGCDEKETRDNKDEKSPEEKKLSVSSEHSENMKEYNDVVLPNRDVTPTAEQAASTVTKNSGDLSGGEGITASKMDVSGGLPLTEKSTSGSILNIAKEASGLPGDEKSISVKGGDANLSDKAKSSDISMVVEPLSHSVLHHENEAAVIKELEGKEDSKEGEKKSLIVSEDDCSLNRIKRAAVTALAATAVKAKVLAEHEEDQIRRLVSMMIEKQLQKLENKLAMFTEIEAMIMRVREQLDRTRRRLYHERTQIITARYGGPPPSSRPSSLPMQRPPFRRI